MRAFLTGATGFVGSAVLRKLLARGYSVRALVRPGGDRSNLAGLDVDLVEGDLQAPQALAPSLAGCDALFHVAADYRLWVPDADRMHAANVDGTKALVLAAAEAGIPRIVYTSSVAVLGLDPTGAPSTEESPSALSDMIGPYKQTKFLAEQAVRDVVRDHGVPAVIVNPSTPVGPRDVKPTPTGRIIWEAMSGRMPAYVDTGLNIVHVDDVAEGHLLAHEKGRIGERYILGGQNMALREILGIVARHVGRRPPLVRLPHSLVMPIAHVAEAVARLTGGSEPFVTVDGVRMARKLMYFSSEKAERELGYAARPATEALRDAIEWFRSERQAA